MTIVSDMLMRCGNTGQKRKREKRRNLRVDWYETMRLREACIAKRSIREGGERVDNSGR
jgi:hypothetical protein